ncbi:MAG: SPP1 phage holin family protein [Bifidobacteriaceae bacterium]|jgi:hypothetical protein|nr:SPP1 phage holin family protein [Bifidobacteriaceae bacterium]MCI1979645.1 SPP1 phage holin family protein [Bifidobacteriaceae bacterium]
MAHHEKTSTPTVTRERLKAFSTLAASLTLTINAILALLGYSPLPFTDTQAGTAVSTVLMVGINVYAWWKNQNVSSHAISVAQATTIPNTTASNPSNNHDQNNDLPLSLDVGDGHVDMEAA